VFLRLAAVATVPLAFLVVIIALPIVYSTGGKLTGFDQISLPGQPLELKGKLECQGVSIIDPDVTGVDIEFLGPDGATLGAVRTAAAGFARLLVSAPPQPGLYTYRVRLKEPRRMPVAESEAAFTVAVVAPGQPIIITDIDGTIADTRIRAVLEDRPQDLPPLPGAADVLRQAAGSFRIVYLSARASHFAASTRHWLTFHGFPKGPVLMRDLWAEWRHFNFSEADFKREVCDDLKGKKGLTGIRWGIGNRLGDAEAYAKSGIRAIVIGVEPGKVPREIADKVRAVASWEEIRKILQ
jgi:hypothetical protein